jgi:hypothetical protein
MINFFRKVRKQLADDNKPLKYMRYAIGEIVLVVIGILIALQINNWNEERKDRIVEQQYLKGLQEEFELNGEQLHRFIKLNDELLEASTALLQYTGPKATSIGVPKMGQLLGNIMGSSVGYESNPGVLEDLINSGNLNKLTNSDLRKVLSLWKADLTKSKVQEIKILKYRDNITDIFIKLGPLRNMLQDTLRIGNSAFEINTDLLLQEVQLENNLTYFMITSKALKYKHYANLEKDVLMILDLISKELKITE